MAPGRRFIAFRYHDVGKKGGVERVASQRPDRTWDTAGWLLSKDLAHVERGRLVPDTVDARKVLSALGATPRHVGGDRFQAKDRPQASRSRAQHSQRRGGERESALITWSARAVRLGRMRAYALIIERLNVHDKHALNRRHQFLCSTIFWFRQQNDGPQSRPPRLG